MFFSSSFFLSLDGWKIDLGFVKDNIFEQGESDVENNRRNIESKILESKLSFALGEGNGKEG